MKGPTKGMIREDKYHPTQLKVFFVMVFLYTCYFACNYNLSTATDHMQKDFGWDNQSFGVLFTVSTLFFGLGQFVAGYLGDRYDPKSLMVIGALGAAFSNLAFSFSGNITLFAVLWGINALSLAMGWSPGCSILFRWIPPKKQGLFMGIFDAFAFMGGIIIYPVAGVAITFFNWRAVFVIPAILLLVWTAVYMSVVKSSPEDAGLRAEWAGAGDKRKATLQDYRDIMCNRLIILTSLSALCSQFVRWGMINCTVKILTDDSGSGSFAISMVTATLIASAMHWGGAVFSIGMGYVSDKVFKGERWQTIFGGFIVSGISLAALYFAGAGLGETGFGIALLALLLFLTGGCIQGVQAPIFNLPGDLLGPYLGGTGVGIINGWSYLGASFAGVALGAMMDSFGLTSIFILLALISVLGAVSIVFVRK